MVLIFDKSRKNDLKVVFQNFCVIDCFKSHKYHFCVSKNDIKIEFLKLRLRKTGINYEIQVTT